MPARMVATAADAALGRGGSTVGTRDLVVRSVVVVTTGDVVLVLGKVARFRRQRGFACCRWMDEGVSGLGAREFAQEIGRPAVDLFACPTAATSCRSTKILPVSSERNPLRSPGRCDAPGTTRLGPSESASEGRRDEACDQISDSILDAIRAQDRALARRLRDDGRPRLRRDRRGVRDARPDGNATLAAAARWWRGAAGLPRCDRCLPRPWCPLPARSAGRNPLPGLVSPPSGATMSRGPILRCPSRAPVLKGCDERASTGCRLL